MAIQERALLFLIVVTDEVQRHPGGPRRRYRALGGQYSFFSIARTERKER
jgi:hypothetical protein